MSVTVRKHCDTCQEETVHLKEGVEECLGEDVCLPCGWRDWRNIYEKDIQENGFEEAKTEWLNTRGGDLNKNIAKELNKAELLTWKKIVYWTNKRFGLPQKEGWEDYKIPDELPMNYTERKYCDACGKESIHLKENENLDIAEQCLPCGWNTWKETQKLYKEEFGFEEAKNHWIETRDWDVNKDIAEHELNPKEKATWKQVVNWTNQFFGLSPKEDWKDNEQEQNKAPFDYQPYLIGGAIGAGIIAFIWLIVVLARRD